MACLPLANLLNISEIALSKYSTLPVSEVVRKIIGCDKDMLDNPAILDFLQKEELNNIPDNLMKSMAPYSIDWTQLDRDQLQREQDPNELTREDQIFLETSYELHHYWKSRIRALVLTRNMQADYQDLIQKLTQVVKVADTIKASDSFKGILDVSPTPFPFTSNVNIHHANPWIRLFYR